MKKYWGAAALLSLVILAVLFHHTAKKTAAPTPQPQVVQIHPPHLETLPSAENPPQPDEAPEPAPSTAPDRDSSGKNQPFEDFKPDLPDGFEETESPLERLLEPIADQEVPKTGFLGNVEQILYAMVNEQREKSEPLSLEAGSDYRLAPFGYSESLTHYARTKSADMGSRDYFSHEDPDGDYILTQMLQDGVEYDEWGENISYLVMDGDGSPSEIAAAIMEQWMNSENQRENILSEKFELIGIGVYEIAGKIYTTLEFVK